MAERSESPGPERGGSKGPDDGERSALLATAIRKYVDGVAAGAPPDPKELIANHPEIESELEEALDMLERLGALTGDARSMAVGVERMPRCFGEYRILREIGRGGMGMVFEAEQPSLDRRVALKVLLGGALAGARAGERFQREARIAAGLQHENIVRIHDLGAAYGVPYFAMELVDGETLQEMQRRWQKDPDGEGSTPELIRDHTLSTLEALLVPSSGADWEGDDVALPGADVPISPPQTPFGTRILPPTQGSASDGPGTSEPPRSSTAGRGHAFYRALADAVAGVANGLHYAHNHGVVHRDLKPSNLIVARDGRIRILDFGLARQEGRQLVTQSRELVGTPPYMSPEQTQGGATTLGRGTDIYGLGATLYDVLSGAPPFRGKTPDETLAQIRQRDPVPLSKRNPEVAVDLETIVMKCLRKSPRERYLTAEALEQDLRRFARGEPIEAQPVSVWQRIVSRTWRSRGKILQMGVLLLLGVITLLYLHGRAREQEERVLRSYQTALARAAAYLDESSSSLASEPPGRDSFAMVQRDGMPAQPENESVGTHSGREYAEVFVVPDARASPVGEAVAILEHAIALCPDRAAAYLHLARALLRNERRHEARAQLQRAFQCEANLENALSVRAVLTTVCVELEVVDLALSWTDELAESAVTWALKAELLAAAGRELEAIEAARAATRLAPEDGSSWLLLGDLTRKVRGAEQALEVYEAALAPSPQARILLALGLAREETGDLAGAREALASAVRHAGASASAHLYLARVLRKLGDLARAEDEYIAASALNPRDPLVPNSLGILRAQQNRTAEALDLFRSALAVDPHLAAAHFNYGAVLRSVNRFDDAAREIREALRLELDHYRVHATLANSLDWLGRTDEAIEEYEKALALEPDSALTHLSLANACYRAGHLERARDHYEEVIRRVPGDSDAHQFLGLTLEKLGHLDRALQEHILACTLDLDDVWPIRDLASLLLRWPSAEPAGQTCLLALERGARHPDASPEIHRALKALRDRLPTAQSMGSIDCLLDRPNPILGAGAEWRYSVGAPEAAEGAEPVEWNQPDFDDSSWLSGPAGFGYGLLSPELATTLPTMRGTHTSLYVRGRFSLPSSTEPRALLLRVRFDDGFVAYLNGEEVARHNAGRQGEVLSLDRTAFHGVGGLPVELSIPIPERLVRRGEGNVLALRGLNQSVDSSDLLLDPEVLGVGEPEVDRDDRLYADLRAALKESPPLLAYLEGRIHQRAGRHEDALEAYRRTLELNRLRGEPTLRIVQVLEAREDLSGAEAVTRRALEEGREPRDVLWEAWSHLAFAGLRWSIEEALRHLPKAPPRPGTAHGEHLRWLLETLRESGTLRINCGGPDYQGPDGRRWASDRLYLGGGLYGATRSVPGEIEGTGDDPLFQTERYWRVGERGTDEAYRIPLPLGEYSVTLHVAEVYWSTADSRVFDVVLEGDLCTQDYDVVLETGGSGVADAMTFTVAVRDGALDIALPARKDNPKLSAVEVSRSGRERVAD